MFKRGSDEIDSSFKTKHDHVLSGGTSTPRAYKLREYPVGFTCDEFFDFVEFVN